MFLLTLSRTTRVIAKLVLDGSDEIAMDASLSAREPHQVSCITYSFAGPTSGTVARSHSSLDRPRSDLAGVCRLRNDVAEVLRELLKIISGPQEHEVPERAGAWLVFPCYFQHVNRANPHIGPPSDESRDEAYTELRWIRH